MAFLDNAQSGEDERSAEFIRTSVVRAQIAKDRGEDPDLIEVTVRYKRMSMSYEETPIIVPRDVLKNVFGLAENFLAYRTLHVDAATGNKNYSRRVFLTPDKELLTVEVVYRDHAPEQNDEDMRRRNLRGRRSNVISVDESQM